MIRRCSRYHREHSSDSLAAGKIQIHFDGNWSDFDLTGARGRDPCKPGGMTPVYRASAFGLGRKGSAAVGTMTVGGRIRNSRMLGKPCNKRIPGRRSAASLSSDTCKRGIPTEWILGLANVPDEMMALIFSGYGIY